MILPRPQIIPEDEGLRLLGIPREVIDEALLWGHERVRRKSKFHPRCHKNDRWAYTTESLAQNLPPEWRGANGYSRVVNEARGIALSVAKGDRFVGRLAEPKTAKRGPKILDKYDPEQDQGLLFEDRIERIRPEQAVGGFLPWYLLYYVTGSEILVEISLAGMLDGSGYLQFWRKRIPLAPIPLRSATVNVEDDEKDIDIPVKRKTKRDAYVGS